MSHFNVQKDFPVFEIIQDISSILEKTFGPHGSTTLIESRTLRHESTKDGYEVLKSLYSTDDLERVILEFVKRISMRIVRVVGDGSTSAVIVSNAIAKALKKFKEDHPEIYAGDLSKMLNQISDMIQKEVAESAKPITADSEDLLNVCRISTNNDEEVSKLIQECYKKTTKFGIVQVELGETPKTEVEYKDGYEMFRGYVDPMFNNRTKKDEKYCELEHTYVLMYEGRLGELDIKPMTEIMQYIMNVKHGSILIIANGFENSFSNFIYDNVNKWKGNLPICCVEHGVGTSAGRNHFYDASVYLDAKIVEYHTKGITLESLIKDNDFANYLGYAERVVVKEANTRFFDGKGVDTDRMKELKKGLEEKIAELGASETQFDYDSTLGALKVRYGRLCGTTAVIKVGGNSKAEIIAKSFLAEDAALAARSALMRGVVPAGNIFIAYLLGDLVFVEKIAKTIAKDNSIFYAPTKELLNLIKDAYIDVFATVSKKDKDYIEKMLDDDTILNVRTGKVEEISETTVLNSAQTDIEIIKGAMSVIGLIGTSNQFIFYPKEYQ